MNQARWVVGEEHDEVLLKMLGSTLKQLGYNSNNEWSGVAGSQDIAHWEFTASNGTIIVETETYMGLSVSGSSELISQIQNHFFQANPNKKRK